MIYEIVGMAVMTAAAMATAIVMTWGMMAVGADIIPCIR